MEKDKEIWEAFRFGDEAAFQRIFYQFYDPLFNYGHKFTTDDFIIEEALQGVFVKLWTNKENLNGTGSAKNYLYKSFRRVLVRKLEYAPRLQPLAETESTIPFLIELAHDDTIVGNEQVSEISRRLTDALDKLSPRQREMIHLRYYEEMEYEQIAQVMDLSVSSTYKLLYRAIDSLKAQFSILDWAIVLNLLWMRR